MPVVANLLPKRSSTAALVVGLALQMSIPAVHAQAINVSRLVSGTQETPPADSAPTTSCQTCTYVTTQAAGATDGYTLDPGPYLASAWPPKYGTALSAIPVIDVLDLGAQPAGTLADGGFQGAHRRARAQFDTVLLGSPVREVSAQTWSNGSARSLVGHAIRILPVGTQALATYVQFKMPREQRAVQYAYKVDANGNHEYKRPEHIQARSTADVIVDGLPVWTSSSMMLVPKRITSSNPQDRLYFYLDQRLSAFTEDTVTLFLGYLTPGQRRQVNVLLRSELRHEARYNTGCFTDVDPVSQSVWRCHSQLEGLSQPAFLTNNLLTARRALHVFTR